MHQGTVGGLDPSEKYEFVSWDDYSQYMEKIQTTNQYGCVSKWGKCIE